ncbi:MAG: DUF420 domain-containing protein [Myxococcaceae bacterium]
MSDALKSHRSFFALNAAVSVLALSCIAYFLVIRQATANPEIDLRFLPAVNAGFNSLAAVCLVLGYRAIRRGRRAMHQKFMVGAFAASTLFLASYLAYHAVHGDTKFGGTGALRVAYLALLASHIVLSIPVVPMALTAFYWAFREDFVRHRKLTRVLLPLWLYVSVTGVMIFVALRSFG